MLRTISTVVKCALVVVLLVGLIGCASSKMKRENEQLKAQVNNLSSELAAAKDENAQLRQQYAGVEGELSKAQEDLEAARKKLAGQGFEVSEREGALVITMPTKILYASGSATLSSDGKSKLQTIAKTLNDNLKGYPIEVQGHTDTDPINLTKDKYKSNWELSYDRAQTVVYFLIKSCGIDPKRVHAGAYGEYSPVASNSAADGKAKNRRVEIVVTQPTSGR